MNYNSYSINHSNLLFNFRIGWLTVLLVIIYSSVIYFYQVDKYKTVKDNTRVSLTNNNIPPQHSTIHISLLND